MEVPEEEERKMPPRTFLKISGQIPHKHNSKLLICTARKINEFQVEIHTTYIADKLLKEKVVKAER